MKKYVLPILIIGLHSLIWRIMDQSMAQPKRISEELYGIFYTL